MNQDLTLLNAVALQQAEASAKRWAKGQPLGPLDGVMMALIDNIDVLGMPCTAGTAAYAERMPERLHPQFAHGLAGLAENLCVWGAA